jgi:hypothetical protein
MVTLGFLLVVVDFIVVAVPPIAHEVDVLITNHPRYKADGSGAVMKHTVRVSSRLDHRRHADRQFAPWDHRCADSRSHAARIHPLLEEVSDTSQSEPASVCWLVNVGTCIPTAIVNQVALPRPHGRFSTPQL